MKNDTSHEHNDYFFLIVQMVINTDELLTRIPDADRH